MRQLIASNERLADACAARKRRFNNMQEETNGDMNERLIKVAHLIAIIALLLTGLIVGSETRQDARSRPAQETHDAGRGDRR